MTEVQQLEAQLEAAKEMVAQRDELLALQENRAFRKLILDQFCVHECARYARESADPALPAHARADALAIAQSAGHLKRYLSVQVQLGNQAAGQIPALEAAIEEARADNGDE